VWPFIIAAIVLFLMPSHVEVFLLWEDLSRSISQFQRTNTSQEKSSSVGRSPVFGDLTAFCVFGHIILDAEVQEQSGELEGVIARDCNIS
jgi:hypothetical protein